MKNHYIFNREISGFCIHSEGYTWLGKFLQLSHIVNYCDNQNYDCVICYPLEHNLREIARKALEPYTNENNPNEKLCNVCKKEEPLVCSDCERLDVKMCKLCHLLKFGTSTPTAFENEQCHHALIGMGRCIYRKDHSGKHMNKLCVDWDTRNLKQKFLDLLKSKKTIGIKK